MDFLRRPRRSIWGKSLTVLSTTYNKEELDELLHPDHSALTLTIRPAVGKEHHNIENVRRANAAWLSPWEATIPPLAGARAPSWQEFPRLMDERQGAGETLSMMIIVDGEIAGLVSVGAVERGAMYLGVLGYWITEKWAGQGITSLAVARTIDLVLKELDLHRIEVNIRPNNEPSLGLARKLGLREEAFKRRFMHINNEWADHIGFAVDVEDLESLPQQSLVEGYVRHQKRDV